MSQPPPPGQPPEWSWTLPMEPGQPDRTGKAPDPAPTFSRTALLTVAGTVLPGLGLIAARRRVVGGLVLGVFLAALATLGIWAAVDWRGLVGVTLRPAVLNGLAVGLVVLALVWVGVVVASHLSLRGRPSHTQRVGGGILVGLLAFGVAAPLAVAARYSYDSADALGAVFGSEQDTRSATRPTLGGSGRQTQDPWAGKPRLNVLLLGGDAGPGREGTRTDTVILASIDTRTGDTTLFSLPRNTGRMPFPKDSPLQEYYPNGFTNGNGDDPEYFLNAIYNNVPATVPENVLGETDDLGADALKLSVGTALGLQVDYYVKLNLQGFSKLVDALGGIRVNINTYVPIGGNTDLGIPPGDYLKPGPNQKLNGRNALWFARGRYGSTDYDRMDRQRCVINAIIEQANPTTMLTRYEDIAKAGKELVATDMPQEVLPLMVDLSLRVKNGQVRSIVFKHGEDGFSSPDPDFALMRRQVRSAIGEARTSAPTTAPTAPPTSSAPSRSASAAGKKDKPVSEDVDDSCAYDPKVAETARPVTG